MTPGYALLWSLGVCVISAAIEGVFAGGNVKQHFAKLRFPSYSIPLWAWLVVGALYYVVCFSVLYRLLRHEGNDALRTAALALLLVMMGANALWNWFFFRSKNLFISFVFFLPYDALALALLLLLAGLDAPATWVLVPYVLYLIYANVWGYWVWRLNRVSG